MVSLGFRALMLTCRKLPESSFSLDFSLKVGKKEKKERREEKRRKGGREREEKRRGG